MMWVSPDQTYADGRWFWGFYQEFGFDVHMQRATGAPMLLTTDQPAIKDRIAGRAATHSGRRAYRRTWRPPIWILGPA